MNINIDMARTLSTRDRNRVLTRFLTWAEGRGFENLPIPSLIELRWNDEFTQLYVGKTSGLLSYGFETLYPEHKPVIDNEKWSVYDSTNPAAAELLDAIRDQTRSRMEVEGG